MNAKSDISRIIELAEAYGRARRLSLKSVSLYAAKRGGFLPALKAGECGITLARRDAIIQWFTDNWPADLAWPASTPRPEATKARRVA